MSTIIGDQIAACEVEAEDLEFVAEALLAMCASDRAESRRGDSHPTLGADALRLRERADRLRAPSLAAAVERRGADPLARGEFRTVMAGAGLTERQREVLALRLEGFRFDEIGARFGSSKQAAQAAFAAALVKLRRTWRSYRYAGFAEVYRAEVRRGRRPPRVPAPAPKRPVASAGGIVKAGVREGLRRAA